MGTLKPLIAAHPFFAGFSSAHLDLITGCASNIRFEAGRLLFRQGEEAHQFYLIRSGKVALEIPAPARGPIIVQTLDEGDILGWSWLVPPYYWRFDARAVELTRALALDGRCLRDKCEADHDLGYQVLKRFSGIIAERLEATCLQLVDVYGVSA